MSETPRSDHASPDRTSVAGSIFRMPIIVPMCSGNLTWSYSDLLGLSPNTCMVVHNDAERALVRRDGKRTTADETWPIHRVLTASGPVRSGHMRTVSWKRVDLYGHSICAWRSDRWNARVAGMVNYSRLPFLFARRGRQFRRHGGSVLLSSGSRRALKVNRHDWNSTTLFILPERGKALRVEILRRERIGILSHDHGRDRARSNAGRFGDLDDALQRGRRANGHDHDPPRGRMMDPTGRRCWGRWVREL